MGDLSAGGLLALFVTMFVVSLFKGWIVPKPQYDSETKSKEYWRAAAMSKDETILNLSISVAESKSTGETIVKVMSALNDKQNEDSDGEGS